MSYSLRKFSVELINVLSGSKKRGGIHFFIAEGRFLVDFYGYTGGTLCKWPKNRVLFLRKSGIGSDLAANELQEVHIEQKSRRKNICASLGPCNPIVELPPPWVGGIGGGPPK